MGGWPGPTSWDPFRDFQREVGRIFGAMGPTPHRRLPLGIPPVNLYEVGDRYVLTTPLPGMGPDEVELSITGETLTIRGERRRPEGIAEEGYRRQERPLGRWARAVTLPERVRGEAVAATFAHGVLTVTIPKAEPVHARQINVAASPPAGPSPEAEP